MKHFWSALEKNPFAWLHETWLWFWWKHANSFFIQPSTQLEVAEISNRRIEKRASARDFWLPVGTAVFFNSQRISRHSLETVSSWKLVVCSESSAQFQSKANWAIWSRKISLQWLLSGPRTLFPVDLVLLPDYSLKISRDYFLRTEYLQVSN